MVEGITTTLNGYTLHDKTQPPSQLKVAIIGAGLGGLTLAHSLKKSGIDFTIFERDHATDARPQGYRIKVHGDTTAALRAVLGKDLWQDFEQTCGETVLGETNINAITGVVTASRKGKAGFGDRDTYTVDRSMLRKVLLKGLESNNVLWRKEFTHYELQDDTTVVAHFQDGTTAKANLLIAADGTRSRVRRQYLPAHRVLDSEGVCIYGKTPITPALTERCPSHLFQWMTLVYDNAPAMESIIIGDNPITLFMEPMRFPHRGRRDDLPDDYVYWALLFRKRLLASTEEELEELLEQPGRELTLSMTSEWDPSIHGLLELQDTRDTAAIRILSVSPDIQEWFPDPRITVLGDAIHVMSPTGGVGACTAIKDAYVLGSLLAEKGLSTATIGEYESQMRQYAAISVQRSFAGGKKNFNMEPFTMCKQANF
ncbi:hypothetical protein ABOM_008731 [Aspergillus bombycis]|uniref:FAD-binding domain-containing protein n=1 Tax=Aspergillus bombycis TaxID=109264 RepID=A0A1F7ZW74_9EURO|nr:hypothetical protein ABOM_008731 [Aspergillus bombycis]OGM43335.1 hypothetical protein ABOM_008731 [Aspergillus bombycis]